MSVIKVKTRIFCSGPVLLTDYGAESLRSLQLLSHTRIFQYVMEPEGLSPCFQKPSTDPYLQPDQSSLYHPILSLRSILILSFYLCVGLPGGLFPCGFPSKILYAFLFASMYATWLMPIPSSFTYSF
jgi:hypothetical protein